MADGRDGAVIAVIMTYGVLVPMAILSRGQRPGARDQVALRILTRAATE